MTKIAYTYNQKTLRFEKAKINWPKMLINSFGVIITGCMFFVGLIYLQSKFFETNAEKVLRKENSALAKHKATVETIIAQANIGLVQLSEEDKSLHRKILLTEPPLIEEKVNYTKESLVESLSAFDALVGQISRKNTELIQKAKITNSTFAKLYWPVQGDIEELMQYPTLPPIPNFKAEALVCGFGNQINPFNKLLYAHNGIDLSAEKGSPVLASGSGIVIIASKSSLPTGLGNYIVISHSNGYKTTYAHLQEIQVHAGQKIKQGQLIGTVGMSGGVIAPHLHFVISKKDKPCNPIQFLVNKTDIATFMAVVSNSKSTKQALD